MSRDAREFAEAASMAMQVRADRHRAEVPQPEIATLINLSLVYSLIEIAESLTWLVERQTRDKTANP
jgi:hypothetical protein